MIFLPGHNGLLLENYQHPSIISFSPYMAVFYCQIRTVRHCVPRINEVQTLYIFYGFLVGLSNSYHMSEVFTTCSADVETLDNYSNTKLNA